MTTYLQAPADLTADWVDRKQDSDLELDGSSVSRFRWMPRNSGRTVVWNVHPDRPFDWPPELLQADLDANMLLCDFTGGDIVAVDVVKRICGRKRTLVVAASAAATEGVFLTSSLPQATAILFDPAVPEADLERQWTTAAASQDDSYEAVSRVLSVWTSSTPAIAQRELFVESIPLTMDERSYCLESEDSWGTFPLALQLEFAGVAVQNPDWSDVTAQFDELSRRVDFSDYLREKQDTIQSLEVAFPVSTPELRVSFTPNTDVDTKDLVLVVDFHGMEEPPANGFSPDLRWSPGLGYHYRYIDAATSGEEVELLRFSGELHLDRVTFSVLRWDISPSKSCDAELKLTLTAD